MANYVFRQKDIDNLGNSGKLRELIAKNDARIARIATAFAELSVGDQKACEAVARKYLALDDERDARREQGLADDEEIAGEQRAEMPEIRSQIVGWFPFIGTGTKREQDEYVLAFLEYIGSRRKAQ